MRIAVEFDWKEIGPLKTTTAGRLSIPVVPAEPGIYRFLISTGSGTEVYIGESDNLYRRMTRNYASAHTGSTNVRIREMLLARLAEGIDVRLAVVRFAVVELDSRRTEADLTDKSVRLLVENAALATDRLDGARILNL